MEALCVIFWDYHAVSFGVVLCHKRTNKKGDIIDDDVDVFQDGTWRAKAAISWIEVGKPRNQCSRLKEQGFSRLNWLFLFLKEWTCVLRYSGQTCQSFTVTNGSKSTASVEALLGSLWHDFQWITSAFQSQWVQKGVAKKDPQIQIQMVGTGIPHPKLVLLGTSWLWGSWGSSRRISLRMAKWILMVLPNSFASWWVRVPQGGRTVSEKLLQRKGESLER